MASRLQGNQAKQTTGVRFMSTCTSFPFIHSTLSNTTSSFTDRDMFSHFAGIGIGHEAQYNIQTMGGTDVNTFEDDTFPMGDCEDEGDNMLQAG